MTNIEQEAKRIVDRFVYGLTHITNVHNRLLLANACAVICVEEMIMLGNKDDKKYWQQVLTEIKNM